jgi:hypothetical protein
MPEKLKFHLFLQPEIQTAASYRKIHIFQIVKAMRLKLTTNFDVNMPEKLKFHLSVQPEIQTAASYRKIHIFQIVRAMRLKFYEHAHKVISNNFGIHFTTQF